MVFFGIKKIIHPFLSKVGWLGTGIQINKKNGHIPTSSDKVIYSNRKKNVFLIVIKKTRLAKIQ